MNKKRISIERAVNTVLRKYQNVKDDELIKNLYPTLYIRLGNTMML